MATGLERYGSLMKENWKKNVILFLTSQTISLFGSSLVQYAIMWYITLETKSGIMMTISIICGFLPTFFLSPLAGVWADRYNRKLLIVFSDTMIAASTLILALLYMNGFKSIWLLFVISSVRAIGGGIQSPAVNAFLPQIVPEDKLTKVNGINGSIQSLILLLSPMVSGALMSVAPLENIFFIDVLTAAIAVFIMLTFIRVKPHEKALQKEKINYLTDFKMGVSYIRTHKYIRDFFVFCGIFLFLVSPAAFLTPLQVARTFGDEVWRLTAIEIVFSIGTMISGLLIASWGGFKNKVKTMFVACLLFGISTLALGVIPNFWIYLFFMFTTGLSIPGFNTPFVVILQERVEGDYLGRIFGVFGMISSSMMPLAMLLFGPLSDAVKIEWLLIGTGVIIFVQAFFLVRNKNLIKVGEPIAERVE